MSEFLKFAYELISQVIYNIVVWLAAFLKLLITGWADYFLIFTTYFPTLNIFAKILAILLMLILIAIPVLLIVLIIRRMILRHQLKADKTDNAALYKEIGRLNKQVLSLIDEKNSILALKVNAMGGTERIPYMGASALTDDKIPTVGNVTAGGNVAAKGAAVAADAGIPVAEGSAAAAGSAVAAAMPAPQYHEDGTLDATKAPVIQAVVSEAKTAFTGHRFPKLTLVDDRYRNYEFPAYNNEITLEEFTEGYRKFAASQMHLYYTPEIAKVEKIVNDEIAADLEVRTDVMTVEEAKKTGAMALFGEKYGEKVRVVSMGEFSKEFCGGTHVKHTGEITAFKIISESGVAAGIRRIEALTGDNVFAYYKNIEAELERAAKAAKTTPAALVEKIEHMMAEIKALNAENESLKSKAAKEALGDVMDQVVEVKGVKLLATSVAGVDMNGLRDLGDQLKGKLGEGVVVLASEADGKVNLVAMATEEAMKKGAHAGNLIKAIAGKVGGGGGGRPNMAQAGGKNPAGIPDAVAEAKTALETQIK